MPFISISCLLTLARISIALLNSSDESRCPCLIPDFKQKNFQFSTVDISCGFFIYDIYHVEILSFYTQLIEVLS